MIKINFKNLTLSSLAESIQPNYDNVSDDQQDLENLVLSDDLQEIIIDPNSAM